MSTLTKRQQEVAERAARGAAQKVIGFELGISVSTVATHLRKALDRIEASRPQLALAMIGMGAVAPPDGSQLRWSALSGAERMVIDAARRGCSNAEIARARARSERTVANQLASAYRKLGVGSRAELFAFTGVD